MLPITPGAEFLQSSAASASKPAALHSTEDSAIPDTAETKGDSAFDTLVGLGTPPQAQVQPHGKGDSSNTKSAGETIAGAAPGIAGAAPGEPGLNKNPASASMTDGAKAPLLAPLGGQSVQGGPESVGEISGADRSTSAAGTETPTGAAAPSAAKNANPPVMATLSPSGTPPQAPVSGTVAAIAAAPTVGPTVPPSTEFAPPANTLTNASVAAQPQAAGVVNAVAAEANPVGRFAQARQGVDERDGAIASAKSKGKSAGNGTSQAGNKHQTGGSTTQPQSNATTPSGPRPEAAGANRDFPPPPPQALAAGAAPLPTDAARVTTANIASVPTSMTDTAANSLSGASRAAAEPGAGLQAPRFTQQTANQLAAQISQRHANGTRVFGIRLDPAELGRVDIRLELSHNNRVHATLTVERGDTLSEMQRSARDLERALNDAGLELEEDGLTLQLSEGRGDDQSAETEHGRNFDIYGQDDDRAQDIAAEIDTGPGDAYGFRLSRRDGVDLRV